MTLDDTVQQPQQPRVIDITPPSGCLPYMVSILAFLLGIGACTETSTLKSRYYTLQAQHSALTYRVNDLERELERVKGELQRATRR